MEPSISSKMVSFKSSNDGSDKTCKLKLGLEDMLKSHSLYACSESGSETAVENESDVKRD